MSDFKKITMSDFTKIDTPRGVGGRSMTPLSATSVSVNYSQTGNFSGNGPDWFGPLLPIQPIAPKEVAGRTFDYIPGYNLATQPRAYEPVTFHTLRALADNCDVLRIVIEKRKAQMARLPWQIRVRHSGNGKRPTTAQLSASTRSRIEEVTELFKRPTFGTNFRSFLRGLLEDLFVCDAPAIFLQRGSSRNIVGLRQLDGATIKRVIDDWGCTPEPIPWDGRRPIDWNGQTVTRENYLSLGFEATNGFLMPPAYQQVLKGLPAVNYTTFNLIYKPMNLRPGHLYGYSPTEQVMQTVSIAMRRAMSQLQYFTEGSQPDALYGLPDTWTPDQIERYQAYWDNMFSGELGNRRRLKFIPGANKSAYVATKEPPLKNEFDEWITRVVCAAFSYPPSAFVSLSNRSIAEQHDKSSEEEGLRDTMEWAADLFNEVISEHLDIDDLEFAWSEESEVDQKVQSEILSRYVSDGVMTINESREVLGLEPSNEANANSLMVKTAAGFVPINRQDDARSIEEITTEED
jgi:hypothetical protein